MSPIGLVRRRSKVAASNANTRIPEMNQCCTQTAQSNRHHGKDRGAQLDFRRKICCLQALFPKWPLCGGHLGSRRRVCLRIRFPEIAVVWSRQRHNSDTNIFGFCRPLSRCRCSPSPT